MQDATEKSGDNNNNANTKSPGIINNAEKAQEKTINPLRLLDMLTLLIKIAQVTLFLQLLGQKVLKTTEKILFYYINMTTANLLVVLIRLLSIKKVSM